MEYRMKIAVKFLSGTYVQREPIFPLVGLVSISSMLVAAFSQLWWDFVLVGVAHWCDKAA